MADSAPSSTPFPALSALNRECLRPPHRLSYSSTSTSTSPPNNDPKKFLTYPPGEPTISLVPAEVHAFLSRELDTLVLDELYSKLWLVARRSGRSIDPLHQQKVKGRDIVPTEDPKLHLVWQHDKIYVKPIPVCLLNHDFWTTYLPLRMDGTSSRLTEQAKPLSARVLPLSCSRILAILCLPCAASPGLHTCTRVSPHSG
jgi:hypothetical protein